MSYFGRAKIGLLASALALLPQAALAESFTLRMGAGHPSGPTAYTTMMEHYLAPEISKRVAAQTKHRVHFVHGYGGSIAKVSEVLESVQSGVLDIGGYCVCFEPAKLFLHNFAYFVPFGPTNSIEAMAISRKVYDQNPWLAAQFSEHYGQEMLALNGYGNYHLGTVARWRTVSDLKGVKIAGAGPNLPWLAHVGAIPVQSALPDGYMSMQTGVYSGWLMFPSSYYSYKFHEPAPHYSLVGFGAMGGAVVVTINSKTMRRLPPDVQRIVREVSRDFEQATAIDLERRQVKGLADLRKSGAHVHSVSPAIRQQWAKSLANFPNRMARDANGRGYPGSQVMSSYIKAAAEAGYQWPANYRIDPPGHRFTPHK